MSPPDLRPLSMPELLDRTVGLFRRNFAVLVGCMAVPVPLAAAMGIAFVRLQTAVMANRVDSELPQLAVWGLVSLVALGVYLLVYVGSAGATTIAVTEAYFERPISIGEAYRRTRQRYGTLLLLTLNLGVRFVGILAVAGFVFGVLIVAPFAALSGSGGGSEIVAVLSLLVGIVLVFAVAIFVGWFFLRYTLSLPAVTFEGLSTMPAIWRSVDLTQGHRWRAFVVLLLVGILGYVAALLFQMPFLILQVTLFAPVPPFWLQAVSQAMAAASGALIGPVRLIGFTLLYFDLRVRKEAFDLETKLEQLPEIALR
ncbi:MAG TPA: glycerophosphoryl diester phosphodiesterase membrane domain-containing protein [Candidatus Polarisedimenticolaceae bacterium]|nr:glycerophosphoryl diester phosphodiesterase membrane domain-containing protein [Candidatus Polarisedimenticolaceae bacterium]